MDLPKSKRTAPHTQVTNCCHTGLSRPCLARSSASTLSETALLSPARRSSTTSPGTMRMRTKIRTATPRRVGNIKRKRLNRYFFMPPRGALGGPGRSCPARAAAVVLLGQPDRVELIVQVVAGGDRPAFHLGAVRDDAVPLERVEHVHLLVEQALLERAEQGPPLVGIDGPRLLREEVVDDLVLVLAVVRVRVRHEPLEVEIGLHDEAAGEVHRYVEVAPLQHRVIGRGLDDLLLDVEPDLPPLVDEPDAHRLVRLRDAAILDREGEAFGHAGLPD